MNFFEILKVLVLGIVEGFTEWLPISSTGHMILVDEIIHLNVSLYRNGIIKKMRKSQRRKPPMAFIR